MRGANGIDVVFLHKFNVLTHNILCDVSALVTVKLVSVGAFKHNSSAVDSDYTVLDFNGPEADFVRYVFDRNTVIFECEHNRVKVRVFTAPRLNICNDCFEVGYMLFACVLTVECGCCAVIVNNGHINAESLVCTVCFNLNGKITVVKL